MKHFIVAAVAATVAVVGAPVAQAGYPEKPIKIIVPYPPGGTTDIVYRLTARHLEPIIGVAFVIVNIKGAGGSVGMLEAMRAKPDGYTVGTYQTNTEVAQAVGVAAYTDDDFVPVALMGEINLTVTAKGDGAIKSLKDLQEAARQRPGEVSIAMGIGSLAHFAAVAVEDALKVDLKLVNAGGGAKKKAAVLGGHVDTLAEPIAGVLGPHRQGQLRVIAVLGPERFAGLSDVPTAKEQGFDVLASQAKGWFMPAGTPKDRVEIFARAVKQLENDAEYQKKIKALGVGWDYKTGDDFQRYIDETEGWVFDISKKLGYETKM
jgi:tripartite-type tricarboxylate transporter receptor subunit TctC